MLACTVVAKWLAVGPPAARGPRPNLLLVPARLPACLRLVLPQWRERGKEAAPVHEVGTARA